MAIPSFDFYRQEYLGISIPESDWDRIATRANDQTAYFERTYTVAEDESARNKAVCAIADAMYTVEVVSSAVLQVDENGGTSASSVSIGSVSTSQKTPDIGVLGIDMSESGQIKQYYKLLCRYMDVYRGVSGCR